MDDVAFAAGRIAGPVRLAGHSAGGHLVTRMICRDSPLEPVLQGRLEQVVSISGLHDLRPLMKTAMNATLRLDAGEATFDGIGGDIKKEGVSELGYDRTPLAALLSTFEGADEVEAGLADIHCPVLLLTSREDHLIDAASGAAVEARAHGPVERVWLEDSYHVATLDNDAPEIESRVVAFARAVLAGPSGATA